MTEAFDDEVAGSARTLVITGSGVVFSAGVDLRRLLAEPVAAARERPVRQGKT